MLLWRAFPDAILTSRKALKLLTLRSFVTKPSNDLPKKNIAKKKRKKISEWWIKIYLNKSAYEIECEIRKDGEWREQERKW